MIIVIENDPEKSTKLSVRVVLEEDEKKPSLGEIRNYLMRSHNDLPTSIEKIVIGRIPKRRSTDK